VENSHEPKKCFYWCKCLVQHVSFLIFDKKIEMDTIRIKRKISSSQLRISQLKEFIGKHVEITIEEQAPRKKTKGKTAAGILSYFKNNDKIVLEKQAWKMIAQEKHGNS